tara:strand:- start:643 stop:744 length:102 start_codon:yes stop_codon:yes gene_type:complete
MLTLCLSLVAVAAVEIILAAEAAVELLSMNQYS